MNAIRNRPLAAVLVTAAFFFTLDAAWIPLKAELAQWLMERAWQRAKAGEQRPRPWPWADTHPVAVLEVPRLGVRQLVLEGASGRNLAFGPAALNGIDDLDLVLSGHRDTHFAMLQALRQGDRLRLETRDAVRDYAVVSRDIVDSRTVRLAPDPTLRRLTLVTCYPFDAATAGGPLRWVVTALPD